MFKKARITLNYNVVYYLQELLFYCNTRYGLLKVIILKCKKTNKLGYDLNALTKNAKFICTE